MNISISQCNKIIYSLSEERVTSYRKHHLVSSDMDVLIFYSWNQEISKAIYSWLEYVEIALRNAIHQAISFDRDDQWWFDDIKIIHSDYQKEKLSTAKKTIVRQKKEIAPGNIIAELNFGFWTSLFNSNYEYQQVLWPRLLPKVFPDIKRKLRSRKAISHRLRDIRMLRNRIFHYEPIWHWKDLQHKYQELTEVLGGLNKELYNYALHRCNFTDVYNYGLKKISREILDNN